MKPKYLTVGILFVIAVSIYLFVINKSDLAKSVTPSVDTPARPGADTETIIDNGWSITPRMQDGERVYWFVPPGENGTSPGVFKKTIHDGSDGKEITIVSECEAPKQTCDRLQQQFDALSTKYD